MVTFQFCLLKIFLNAVLKKNNKPVFILGHRPIRYRTKFMKMTTKPFFNGSIK